MKTIRSQVHTPACVIFEKELYMRGRFFPLNQSVLCDKTDLHSNYHLGKNERCIKGVCSASNGKALVRIPFLARGENKLIEDWPMFKKC